MATASSPTFSGLHRWTAVLTQGLLVLILGLSAPAWSRAAEPIAPLAFVRSGIDEVIAVAYAEGGQGNLESRMRPVLERFFAFEGLTRRAIGPGWRDFTPEQQAEARELFTKLVIRTYARRFDPSVRPEITLGKAMELERGRREVTSTVTYSGSTYSVVYRLDPAPPAWRVSDVIIEGVGLVSNYRAQFEALHNRGGATAVIDSMRTSLASEK